MRRLRLVNAELELRVRKRTAELETANKELEAFSYSVSHDLRAPVRAVEGFTQSLLQDHAAELSEPAKDLLQRVEAACVHMGQLIEDLLNLARVARTEMRRENVDLSAMANESLAELQRNAPQRRVNVRVAEGLVAHCDPRLLRAALENLLGNAWKFTSKQPDATLEFGMETSGDQNVFFVRDNGAGFDMEYAAKLFGAFQRLHSTSEFPGTGVGLATVQRILHRHGGRIWAEGKVGQGATFRFVL
jgi:light-regulated signal transduction histidine kinase (bacteriophytochrome)